MLPPTRALSVLSLVFFLVFLAWHAQQNITVSAHSSHGVDGSVTLAITYGCIMVSSVFAPAFVGAVGLKRSMLLGFSSVVVFMCANCWPRPLTTYAAAAFFGALAAPMWVAQGQYITMLVVNYAFLTRQSVDECVGLYNGVFLCLFQLTQLVGNAVSGGVMTMTSSYSSLYAVFAGFCGVALLAAAVALPPETMVRLSVAGDKEELNEEVKEEANEEDLEAMGGRETGSYYRALGEGPTESSVRRVGEMARMLQAPDVVLLLPLMTTNGLLRAFIFGTFTKGIQTVLGTKDSIGFVMMAFGLTDAAATLLLGQLSDSIGRSPILVLGTVCHGACLVATLFQEHWPCYLHFCLVAGLWGLGDACWYTMIPAHLSANYTDRAAIAFGIKTLFEAAAATVVFAASPYISLQAEVWALLAFLLVGMLGYYGSLRLTRLRPPG